MVTYPPFPLSPNPSGYADLTASSRSGVYEVGTTPTFTLSQAGATAYVVRDYWGNVLSSGPVTGTTITPTAPAGGWRPGWYRLYLTGTTDSVFGPSKGATCFTVIRHDSRFTPMPASPLTYGNYQDGQDNVMRGVMAVGPQRFSIRDAASVTTSGGAGAYDLNDATAGVTACLGTVNTYTQPTADPARPRPQFLAFPNGGFDYLTLSTTSSQVSVSLLGKTETVDTTNLAMAVAAGTTTGVKITLTSGSTSEVYDNIVTGSAAVTAINAGSALVKVFLRQDGPLAVFGSVTMGSQRYAGVKQCAQTLTPLGLAYYEGPSNEPQGLPAAEVAHQMRLFAAAVKAGSSSAKAVGPNPVTVATPTLTWLAAFLDAGGGNYCDAISFHSYNVVNGDINLGRASMDAFKAVLTARGLAGKPLWQTEQGQLAATYGVFHPRRARWALLHNLLLEQYGIPREQNYYFYDTSHGFWSVPTFAQCADQTLLPQVAMFRVLAEETFGRPFTAAINFSGIEARLVLGNVYVGSDGTSVAVLLTTSALPGATVTLNVTGTATSLTLSDCFGNLSTLLVKNGQVVVPVAETPSYLRIPSGVTVADNHVQSWPTSAQLVNTAPQATTTGSGSAVSRITDGVWQSVYDGSNSTYYTAATSPDTITFLFPAASRADRVLIFAGSAWQAQSTLTDFDVAVTKDGVTWTVVATVTKAATSFVHGTDSSSVGCQSETYWDEQWVFDVTFTPIAIKGIRLVVRGTTYGGEPDAGAAASGGQGGPALNVLQEVLIYCDDNTRPQYLRG